MGAANEITSRDRRVADLDLFLSSAGWDLWSSFEANTGHTSEALISWWVAQSAGRAILILRRPVPARSPVDSTAGPSAGLYNTRVQGDDCGIAGRYQLVCESTWICSEIILGKRSSRFGTQTRRGSTDSVQIPFKDCAPLIGAEQRWVLWHHWPDVRLHALSEAGQGLNVLTAEVETQLRSDDFWGLVHRLTTGRRLVITSDHGYGASGLFSDVRDDQADYLKQIFKSGRFAARIEWRRSVGSSSQLGNFLPPRHEPVRPWTAQVEESRRIPNTCSWRFVGSRNSGPIHRSRAKGLGKSWRPPPRMQAQKRTRQQRR